MNLLTIKEVAKVLKINPQTAYRYAKEGAIPAVLVGKTLRVEENILIQWITERSGKTTGAWKRKKPEKKK